MTTVVVSVCVGFAVARTELAFRLMLSNSAVVPIAGLVVVWLRGNDDGATWYGYLVVWSVAFAVSVVASLVGYGLGKATRRPSIPT